MGTTTMTSSLRPLCRASRVAAGCACRLYTQYAMHANARRGRVSHRAPAVRPHCADQIRTRVRCARNREGQIFDLFGPPKSGWVCPRRALQCCSSSWFGQAKKAAAEKKAAEEAEKVRSSPRCMDAVSVALRATRCSCVERRHRSHSHSALCRTPAVRWRVRVREAGRRGRPRVRPHCCSRRQH
jgi:hypothetical protein